jgi:hypothetical protein
MSANFTPPANTVTTMDAVHDAIVAALRAHFGERVLNYGAYDPWNEYTDEASATLETPALLLELEGFNVPEDVRDPLDRIPCECSWVIHAVLGLGTPRLQQTLPQFAAAVASLVMPPLVEDAMVRGNLWGLGAATDAPVRVSAQPGEFQPGLHGRDAWVIRWDQTIYLDQELPAE